MALEVQTMCIFTCPRRVWGRKCVRGVPNLGIRGPGGANHVCFYVSQDSVGQEMREGCAKLEPSCPWGAFHSYFYVSKESRDVNHT